MSRIAAGAERPRNDMASGKGRQTGRGRTPPLRIAGEPVQRGGGVRSPRPTANMETGRCGHRPLRVQDKGCSESGRQVRRPLRVQDKECGEAGRRGRGPLRSVTSGAGDREGRPYGGVLLVRWAGRRMRGRMEKAGRTGWFVLLCILRFFIFCVFQRQLSLWKNMATVPGPTWAPVTGS